MPKPYGITCILPGCTHIIKYGPNEDVPLYCEFHRTLEGKHSQMRYKTPEPHVEAVKQPLAIFMCVNRKCGRRETITYLEWKEGKKPSVCEKCGSKMTYHKDG